MQYSTSESTQFRSATPALLSFSSGVWYRARLRIGGDQAFVARVWQRDNPGVRGEIEQEHEDWDGCTPASNDSVVE